MVQRDDLMLRLTAISYAAATINLYEWRSLDGAALPAFTAGAHVDLHLPNGLVRQYSLANSQHEPDRYVVGVKLDAASRGGSRFLHETLRVGDVIKVSVPRNNFPLQEAAGMSVFLAGGIGITPIRCMIDRLSALGRHWKLYYSVRQRPEAAFMRELLAHGEDVVLHVDEEKRGFLDVAHAMRQAPADAHLYCCGPLPMLAAFEAATAERPRSHVHLEYFSSAVPAAAEGEFMVRLDKSGREIAVPKGCSILTALQEAGIDVPFSCAQGVCGACETRVLQGLPDHRDMILSETEKAANNVMMICCSGSHTPLLVLDL